MENNVLYWYYIQYYNKPIEELCRIVVEMNEDNSCGTVTTT